METKKISFLCRLSERIHDNAAKAAVINSKDISQLEIKTSCQRMNIDFDDYPELKPVAEKLLNYLVKCEEAKQNEIKIEIAKVL